MPDRPGFLRGMIGRIGDKFVWGNNYNRQTGQWQSTPGQVLGGIGSRALNMFVPGAGTLVNAIGNGYNGSGPAARFFNHGPGNIGRAAFGFDTSLSVPNIGMNPGVNPSIPTAPTVTSQADWQALNPFQQGSGLAYAQSPQGGMAGRPIGGGLSFGGGRAGYNNGAGAGTGFGAFNVMNDSWGEPARDFGVGGMSGGSRDMPMQQGPKFFVK